MLNALPNAVAVSSDDVDHAVPLPFTDVSPENWFYEQVRSVFEQGLMTGTGELEFSPNMRVTRAMVVQVLYNRNDRPNITGFVNPFTDVAVGAWYHDAVVWAVTRNVVHGLGDGTFAPGDDITRAHLTVILNNYAGFARLELPPRRDSQPFADYMDIRNYAKEAIDRFFRAGIINGTPYGKFYPQGNATRAEFATMLSQFVRYSENLPGGGGGDFAAPPYGYVQTPDGWKPIPPDPPTEPPKPQPEPPGDDNYAVPPYGVPCCCDDYSLPAYGFPDCCCDDVAMPEYGFPCWVE